jgi:23S rRNA (uracil1939-C5)-methyltransferase
MHQGSLLPLTIEDLSNNGEGVGRWENRVIFVPDTVIGDRIITRLVRVKPNYAHGKLHELITPSPDRIRPQCIVADKCGGCQWQHIDYAAQLAVKRNLVLQNLQRIGGFTNPPVDPVLSVVNAEIVSSDLSPSPPSIALTPTANGLGYRNKVTYPFGVSATQQVQVGYYQKGSHHLINLNQCPIQDPRLNPFLQAIKQDIQHQGWSIYDETTHQGELRHLGLRIGRRTGEVLLTLVAKTGRLSRLETQAQTWIDRYPELVGVAMNINGDRTNAIFGAETQVLAGRSHLHEQFAGLMFQVHPTTFFQVFTEQAEALLTVMIEELNLQGDECLLDAYCGIGTLTLPLAKRVRQAIGIEMQVEAIAQARINAALNGIENAEFHTSTVEQWLPNCSISPDVVVLDPPRKGCDASVIQALLQLLPQRIVYVSCNPATLARDLKLLSSAYQLTRVQPADFFPQTAHVESAAFLVR